jgi:Prp8 binding protein
MKGHKGCILDLNFNSDSSKIVSNSSDKTLQIYDVEMGKRIKKLVGHSEQINSSSISNSGNELMASASDDSSMKLWDPRDKSPIMNYLSDYPLTSAVFS